MEQWIIIFNANMREEKFLESLTLMESTFDINKAKRFSPIEVWSVSHTLIMAGVSHTLKKVTY